MNTRKIYRVELTEIDSIFKDMVLEAAVSNSGAYVPLIEIAAGANHLCRKYPTTGSCHTVNLVGNVLHIDKGEQNIVTITEIEVIDLEMPQITNQEAKELLKEITGVPTIDSYGITDENNMELIN